MKNKIIAVAAVAVACAWLARAGEATIMWGATLQGQITADSVTGTIGGTAVAQVTNIAHAVTDPAAAAGSNYAWAVAGSAYQSATGAVPGIVSNMGLSAQSTLLATNAFRMVPANDPQGITNWSVKVGADTISYAVMVGADSNAIVVTDAGGSNPGVWGRHVAFDSYDPWQWRPGVQIDDPVDSAWGYQENGYPGVWYGNGPSATGSVYVSYAATTNVTTNATTAYVDAATAGKATPLDATNAALAVAAPYTNGATLGATALQPAATNGLARNSALSAYLPLAAGAMAQMTGPIYMPLANTSVGLYWNTSWRLIKVDDHPAMQYMGSNYYYPAAITDGLNHIWQWTDGDTSAMSGRPSGAASVGALATVSNATISAWTPAAITVGTVWLDWARSTAWAIAVTNASYAINASNTPAASPRTMQLLLTTPATVTPAITWPSNLIWSAQMDMTSNRVYNIVLMWDGGAYVAIPLYSR